MTEIPLDDILERLFKLRIRESEKLKIVLELYDLEIHQKKIGPNYHRLKTMVKRSIEEDIRNKNFGIRNGNFEKNAVVNNQGNKTACAKNSWRLLALGNQRTVCERRIAVSATILISVEKLHHQIRLRILSCSRMSENHREPEVPEEKVPVVECFDGLVRITLRGTCNNSFDEKWHPPECLFYKIKSGCRYGAKQPTKRSQKNVDKSAVALLKKGD